MKQSELIKQLSDKELKRALIHSQVFFLALAFIASFFLFTRLADWKYLFQADLTEIFYYGVLPALLIVCIDLILITFLPKRFYDDGGINERIFKSLTVPEILLLTILIAISEEFLFRGVLQTVFGYFLASATFAFVHVRYLRKPVLLLSVLFVSFYLGYLFELTGNLFVTITAHFLVDFLLGLLIRFHK